MTEKIIRLFLQPLRLYAACGFVVSAVLHVLVIAGLQPNNNALLIGPGVAIFPLWLPVTRLVMNLTRGLSRKETWTAMMSGCPKWMRTIVSVLYWYAMANFAIAVIITFVLPAANSNSASAPRFFWILASSYYMLFYFSGLATLTTARERGSPTCPNGHPVSINDKYCPRCGAPIQQAQSLLSG